MFQAWLPLTLEAHVVWKSCGNSRVVLYTLRFQLLNAPISLESLWFSCIRTADLLFINICIRQDRLAEFRHNKELPKMPTFRLISCSAPVCNHRKTKTSYGIYLFLSTIYPSGDGNLIVGELLILYNKPLQPFLSPISIMLWFLSSHHPGCHRHSCNPGNNNTQPVSSLCVGGLC